MADEEQELDLGGRPTKYDPSFVQAVDEYLAQTGKEQTTLPKIASFALFLNVTKKTLYNWEKKYPEFLHALEKLRMKQEEQLLDDGIYGGKEVNPTIVKLALQNNFNYKERQDVTTNDKDIPTPIYNGKSAE
jgi:uncharacterized Zn finger protein